MMRVKEEGPSAIFHVTITMFAIIEGFWC